VVRTELGREIIVRMLQEGVIIGRDADSDPEAIELMHKLSKKSRQRWPSFAEEHARLGLPEVKGRAN
jgi:coenzyme F420 hydrogenase subunit beta